MGLSEIKGRKYNAPVWGITTPDGQKMDQVDLPFRQALDRGGPVRDIRMAIEWPNGKRQILSVNAVPYRDANGKTLVITSFVNVTEEILKTELLESAPVRPAFDKAEGPKLGRGRRPPSKTACNLAIRQPYRVSPPDG